MRSSRTRGGSCAGGQRLSGQAVSPFPNALPCCVSEDGSAEFRCPGRRTRTDEARPRGPLARSRVATLTRGERCDRNAESDATLKISSWTDCSSHRRRTPPEAAQEAEARVRTASSAAWRCELTAACAILISCVPGFPFVVTRRPSGCLASLYLFVHRLDVFLSLRLSYTLTVLRSHSLTTVITLHHT